jgi:uncharacterized protein YecE (DUF72 family)
VSEVNINLNGAFLMIQVGCCGFPVKRKIYYQNFTVVEIQQTFYQPPQITTGIRWRGEAPSDFEFTMKSWQLITHEPSSPTYRRLQTGILEEKKKDYGSFKGTEEVDVAWSKTSEFAKALGVKKIVFQSPQSFYPSTDHIRNLRQFFKKVKRDSFVFIWEPRGKWERGEVERLCKELDILPCLDPFIGPLFQGNLLYVRLHGKTGYRYTYSDEELMTLLEKVKGCPQTYLMFNNVNMNEDAHRFKKILEGKYYLLSQKHFNPSERGKEDDG